MIKGFDGDFVSGTVALLVDGMAGAYVDNFRVGKGSFLLPKLIVLKLLLLHRGLKRETINFRRGVGPAIFQAVFTADVLEI